ncbi:hypothetical protein ANN_00356 [Periplaneta americana]|uniref:Uncharacterized protein n=1 Tax=Periplaneta americana TaxID=6978 RepID=A0ABQ8TQT7_PERAM|nr:hypothetical protein ANN_00356 [Periplaneta americana]
MRAALRSFIRVLTRERWLSDVTEEIIRSELKSLGFDESKFKSTNSTGCMKDDDGKWNYNSLEDQIKDKQWKDALNSTLPEWPRREAVATFRTAVGHDCLANHLHRLGVLSSPHCMLCECSDNMDSNHIKSVFRISPVSNPMASRCAAERTGKARSVPRAPNNNQKHSTDW